MNTYNNTLTLYIENDSFTIYRMMREVDLIRRNPLMIIRHLIQGLKFAARKNHQVKMIYVAEALVSKDNMQLLKDFSRQHDDVPVVIVRKTEVCWLDSEFKNFIFSPTSYKDLVDFGVSYVDRKSDWKTTRPTAEVKFQEFDACDTNYLEIPVHDFTFSGKSYFNVFLKLGATRFVKIINAGDAVDMTSIKHYWDKGFSEFYVTVDEHMKYVAFIGQISQKLVQKEDTPEEVKVRSTLMFGARICQSLNQLGISREKLEYADRFLNQTTEMVKNIKCNQRSIKEYIDVLENNEHSAGVALLASLIASEIGFQSQKTINQIGIGALLHDIGLYTLRPDMEEKEVNKMTPEEYQAFKSHAVYGANLLRQSGYFDEVVCLIVEKHHQRRRGTPIDGRSTSVNLATEVVSCAEELYNSVVRDAKKEAKLENFMKITAKGFSIEIEKALERLFPDAKRSAAS